MTGHGFQLIAPSRFGYLRSALPDNLTTAMQADAYVRERRLTIWTAATRSRRLRVSKNAGRSAVCLVMTAQSACRPLSVKDCILEGLVRGCEICEVEITA
jgi:hypothetical protein